MKKGRARGQTHSTAHNEKQRDLLDPQHENFEHLVRETFAYDDTTVIDKRNGEPAGTLAGHHLVVSFLGRMLQVSHIAWLLHEGRWPHPWLEIDHANRDGTDNTWNNLREATYGQNTANTATRSKTGHKGVYQRHDGKYTVVINTKYHGCFHNLEAAAAKAQDIRKRLYGDFAKEPTTGATANPNRSGDDYTSPRKKRAAQQDTEPNTQQLKLWPEEP